ncbi:MAG: helix-turn-helix domain-containing protein [Pseudomonadota bacterium]
MSPAQPDPAQLSHDILAAIRLLEGHGYVVQATHQTDALPPSVVPLQPVCDAVRSMYGVTHDQLRGDGQQDHLIRARTLLAVAARRRGISNSRIGRAINRDRSTVADMIGKAEKRLGDRLDLLVEHVEKLAAGVSDAP